MKLGRVSDYVRLLHRRDRSHQRGLARAVRTEKAVHPRRNREGSRPSALARRSNSVIP